MENIGLDLNKAASILLDGGVVAFPTETVMGMGVVFDNFNAYKHLNELKGRPEDKPYTMMLGSVEEIEKYAYIDDDAKKIINAFMPGPITVLLKARENVPSYVTHATNIVGIRVPDFDIVNKLLKIVKKPLLSPSANPSGMPPALDPKKVTVYFDKSLEYIIDYSSKGELPSTIVDLTKDIPIIIREGSIKKELIFDTLKENKVWKLLLDVTMVDLN